MLARALFWLAMFVYLKTDTMLLWLSIDDEVRHNSFEAPHAPLANDVCIFHQTPALLSLL